MANDLGYTTLATVIYKDPVTVSRAQGLQDNITALASLLTNFKQGVTISYVNSNTLQVETGCIMINNKLRRNTTTSTVNWASTGGNGIAETSSTGYYIWAYASGTTSTFELAINQTSVSMTGNANARLIGWFWNDTGNNIEGCWWKDENERKHYKSRWLPVAALSAYTINHNLNTFDLTTILYSNTTTGSPSDGTGMSIEDWGLAGIYLGIVIKNYNLSQVVIETMNNFHALPGSTAVEGLTSGTVKLIMETL